MITHDPEAANFHQLVDVRMIATGATTVVPVVEFNPALHQFLGVVPTTRQVNVLTWAGAPQVITAAYFDARLHRFVSAAV